MAREEVLVVHLIPQPGSDGFWTRENYFEGGARNGYAMCVRTSRPFSLARGDRVRLVIPNHVPHLPYTYEGEDANVRPGDEILLLFTWGGKLRRLSREEIEKYLQHALDPGGETETLDDAGHPVRQRGRRGGPILYTGEVDGTD